MRKGSTLCHPLAQVNVIRSYQGRLDHLALAVSLLLLGMNSVLFAQVSTERHSLNFRTMGWGVARDDLFYSVDGEDVSVKIFDAGRSSFYEYPTRGEISFYRIVEKEDGTVERVAMAKGNLSGKGPTPLLILTESKTHQGKFDMNVISDDLTAFPEQSCRFVNFTPIEIGVSVGKEIATVPPGGIRLMDTNLEQDAKTKYVTLFVEVTDNKHMLSYNTWVFRPGQRVMVFIFVDNKGQPRVIRLVDAVASLASFLAPRDSR